jgi:hypothetical protein
MQQVRFGGEARREGGVAPTGVGGERSRSARSTGEVGHTTSTPTGSDKEQRLKEGFEGISTIKEARPHTSAPRREASPGQASTRRACQSPTESSDDEDDSYLGATRGRKAEGQSSSPKPRRSFEWRGWDRSERARGDSLEKEEHLRTHNTKENEVYLL